MQGIEKIMPLKNRYINDTYYLNKQNNRLVHVISEHDDFWNWQDKNGKSLWTENLDYYYSFKYQAWETEFNTTGHLVCIRKSDTFKS